jgi:hypothetical protein
MPKPPLRYGFVTPAGCVMRMQISYLPVLALVMCFPVFGAGKAGDIVSLECSRAIASIINFIEESRLEIDLDIKDGEFTCVGPVNGKLHLRIQSPDMDESTKKHYFEVDAKSYVVEKHAFSR